MTYNQLPNTDIKVSKLCLGSMTWGNQNTEAEGHEQLNYAFEQGINFIDTAELYPVPAEAKTQGLTSEIIGTWLQKTKRRDQVIIASKIAGKGDYTAHIRTTGFQPTAIVAAIDAELKRLQTDYIDLYQLHWPERQTNIFGVRDYKYNPEDPWEENFETVLHTLKTQIDAGKIRHIGLSNEKAWGVMRFLEASKTKDLPRILTTQNPYSLLTRTYEGDLAEISMRENVGLLAYSPMAFGVLSGKYLTGNASPKARLSLFPRFARYSGQTATEATKRYLKLAQDNAMSLAQMALAFVTQQPFVTSNIIGATTLQQLKENIDSTQIILPDAVLAEIDAIHNTIPNPAP